MGGSTNDALAAVLDSLPLAITSVSPEGEILFVNALAAANLSASRSVAIGRSVYEFFPALASSTRERIRQVIEAQAVQYFEAIVTLPDGRERQFESSYCPAFSPDGAVVSIQILARDITPERRSGSIAESSSPSWRVVTDDLSMTARRMKALVDNAPMVVSVFDPDGKVRYTNRLVEGLRQDEILGQSVFNWVREDSRSALASAFSVARNERRTSECEVEGISGRSWFVRLAPLIHDGHVAQILGCTLDITDRKRLEAQLLQKSKIESLGTMASGIAHDFNNLLTAIMGNASLARTELQNNRDPNSMLDQIETAAQRAAELCNQMMVYAGRDPAADEPGDLNAVVSEMVQLARAAIGSKIRVHCRLVEPLPPARCNRPHLGQIALNLVKNAADAIGDEQGEVRIATRMVEVSAREDYLPEAPPPGRYLCLEVADTGPGVDEQHRERIFDPFYSTKTAGHGLGLSVVMGILASQGGAIRVISPNDGGTTMRVLLPIHGGEVRSEHQPDRPPLGSNEENTILVVDDDDAVRRVAVRALVGAGYEVLEAADGDAALAQLARHGDRVRAVILDVTMPRRDGYSTLRELRKTLSDLPVILCSGRPAEQEFDARVRFFSKPYLPDALANAVREVLRGWPSP